MTEVCVHLVLDPPLLGEKISWLGGFDKEFSQLLKTFATLKQSSYLAVDLGNPHVVLNVASVQDPNFFALGASAQKIPPLLGINLTLYQELGDVKMSADKQTSRLLKVLGGSGKFSETLSAKTWERGVGPTGACGTAACAVALAHLHSGFSDREKWVLVEMPGGSIAVRQKDADGPISLAGPALRVFTGVVDI